VSLRYTPRIETPLTPLEFMRRARRHYPAREAVVDGALRFSYAALFDRCDRWAAYLRGAGVKPGDRVVYIAPNTHATSRASYAVPMLGAVLVPVNYRSRQTISGMSSPTAAPRSSARMRITSMR
jgi:fatty-acyl-CoA synthase